MDSHLERPSARFPEPDSERYYAYLRKRQLMYQVCTDCGTVVFYPRSHCTGCLGTRLRWLPSLGMGTIYSHTVLHRHGHPYFQQKLPYVLAFVDMDEGFRLLTKIVEATLETLTVGQRVSVHWLESGGDWLPAFRPLSTTPPEGGARDSPGSADDGLAGAYKCPHAARLAGGCASRQQLPRRHCIRCARPRRVAGATASAAGLDIIGLSGPR